MDGAIWSKTINFTSVLSNFAPFDRERVQDCLLLHLSIGRHYDTIRYTYYNRQNINSPLLWLVYISPRSSTLIPCQCFMETYRGYISRESKNKSYQEKDERFNME
jgi:hypothetical protein